MSSFLYGLGRAAFRHRRRVLAAWIAGFVLLGGLALVIGGKFDESFTLPGTESQTALDSLGRTFPQVSGTSAQVIVVAPDGASVRDSAVRTKIEDGIEAYGRIDRVDSATSPFDKVVKGTISDDQQAAIIAVQLDPGEIQSATLDALQKETEALQASIPGSTVSVGGQAYSDNAPGLTPTEGIGVVIALIVLFFTLGSLRAAGMPLITAVLGVGITMTLIFAATGLATVSSTTPLLALMLGLAVGIDYALFILSRHRDQLADGMEPEESTARSVATSGSAVVFAGLTVMIALTGLAVARIPFLTTMGVAAAIGVAVAVAIALTLLPAMLGFAGAKLTPKPRKAPRSSRSKGAASADRSGPSPEAASNGSATTPEASEARATSTANGHSNAPVTTPARVTLAHRWVRGVTRWPIITILVVVAALGALTYPAKDLRIALPDNGSADPGTNSRVTYDLVSDHFGEGFNGPLIVTATIVGSTDPLGLMDDLADKIRALPGVANVPLATPNQNADTGIVQVVPTTGPDSAETKALVLEIRGLKGEIKDELGVDIAVTGATAVAIDVSDRLGKALLPFGILVVGLSLVLLTMVFRSIAVPLKATVGYLLTVGASFGATALVFEKGLFSDFLNVNQTGPVISFLPILLMGILFGLAMDYEVFLVSRMREDYVHGGDARVAIESGFAASSKVVVAAAVIMFAVFAAFVPEGEGPIKTIAFGLAVGVFVDAFIVRMTFVPAVLALLGDKAWSLPRWIDQRLPSFDVEGEALAHQVALADWPTPNDDHLVYAEGLQTSGADHVTTTGLDLAVRPGEILVVQGEPGSGKSALLLTLAGRMAITAGQAKIDGLVLPQQAGVVRRRTAFVNCAEVTDLAAELRTVAKNRPSIVFVDHAERLARPEDRLALANLLDQPSGAVVLATTHREDVADLIATGYAYLTVGPTPDRAPAPTS